MGKVYKRGKKWGISYIDPNGKQVRKMISPYKETAQQVLKKIEMDIIESKYLDIRKDSNILFGDIAEAYFNGHVKINNRNINKYRLHINRLVRYFEGKSLSQMTSVCIKEFTEYRIKTIKPSSVNRDLALLSSIFNFAIKEDKFSGINPLKRVRRLPENNKRNRHLKIEELNKLLACCSGHTKLVILIASYSGLRWSEIRHLKWYQASKSNYIDLDNNQIYIHESLTKSKKERYIPLSPTLKRALLKYSKHPKSEYVFFNPKTNKPVVSIKASFKNALQKAQIEDFQLRDLRHTFASLLVNKDVDLYRLQMLLGHSNIQMTQRYSHLNRDRMVDAIMKLEENNLQLDDLGYNKFLQDSTKIAHDGLLN